MSYPITWPGVVPDDALLWARNGIAPSGCDVNALASYLNGLGAWRKKEVFAKTVPANSSTYNQSEITLWRFPCHTGPFTAKLRAEFVLAPTRNPAASGDSSCWWESNTGLAGSGTTVAHGAAHHWTGDFSGTITPDMLVSLGVDMTVAADQDYTWSLKVKNGCRVVSATVYEEPLSTLSSGVTSAVDAAGMGWGKLVTSADVAALLALGDKLWRRGGHHYLGWTEYAGIACTSATYVNLIDQTIAAWAATSPGLVAPSQYQGSLDSAAVPVTWATYAKVNAGTAKVRLAFDGAESNGLEVSSTTGAWLSGTMTGATALDSATAEEKLDMQAEVVTATTLTVYAASAWSHVA